MADGAKLSKPGGVPDLLEAGDPVAQGAAGTEAWPVSLAEADIPQLLHLILLELQKLNAYQALEKGFEVEL